MDNLIRRAKAPVQSSISLDLLQGVDSAMRLVFITSIDLSGSRSRPQLISWRLVGLFRITTRQLMDSALRYTHPQGFANLPGSSSPASRRYYPDGKVFPEWTPKSSSETRQQHLSRLPVINNRFTSCGTLHPPDGKAPPLLDADGKRYMCLLSEINNCLMYNYYDIASSNTKKTRSVSRPGG